MNFGKSFTYMFDDDSWLSKLLIGSIVSIVPILNIAWFGYGIGIMRNMARGLEKPLPSWDNLGEKFKDGLMLLLAILVYALPALIVLGIGGIATAALDNDTALALVWVVVGCCASIYLLAFSFLVPALMIHYSRTNSFRSLFQVSEVFKLATRNIGDYLLAWVTGMLANTVFSMISPMLVLLCFFPVLLGFAWVTCVSYYAYGQVGLSSNA